jgi:hypothetical protein
MYRLRLTILLYEPGMNDKCMAKRERVYSVSTTEEIIYDLE